MGIGKVAHIKAKWLGVSSGCALFHFLFLRNALYIFTEGVI
jgi:hypothetical protein